MIFQNSSCSFVRRESCSSGATPSYGSTSAPPCSILFSLIMPTDYFYSRDMSGGATNDPFAAYQEAAKVMSAKKGSSSRSTSGDEVMITGSCLSPVVKLEPSPSLPGKRPKSGGVTIRSSQQSTDIARSAGSLATALSNLNLNVFPQDGTVLPIGYSSELIQVLQGGLLQTVSQLHHLGGRLSDEGLLVLRAEVEVLKCQVSRDKEKLVAREFEIRDFKEKIKDLEKVAEASSADALGVNQKNQELEEDIEALKAAAGTFKFEMVMAVNGARVVARWELMREWLRKQSAQWDLVTTLEQYKAVVREEARSKGAPLPTFEDEPGIPPSSYMDVDSSMKDESGLFPDSSSIGSRVRSSKVKDAVAPLMEDPKAIVALNVLPVAEGNRYPPIGPLLVIGVEEVADWRMKYNLPADVIIRVPGSQNKVSDFCVNEILVYEGYFESGFRDRVPSLVAKISETLEIFPGQLNPPVWRTLITLQNLGDLQGLVIGVAKEPPVREVPKRERKSLPVFAGNWTEKFAFMRLPGFLPIWQLEGRLAVGVTMAKKVLIVSCFLDAHLPRVDCSSGRETIERVLRLPIERRQIRFLVSKAALKRCSIWGSKGDEALAKSAPKRAASVDDDEVQFLRSSKRLKVAATAPSSSKNKSNASGSSPSTSYDWTTVLTNLNTNVFPSTPVLLALEEDSSVAIQSLQGDLLQVASQLFHLGEKMVGATSTKAEMDALAATENVSLRGQLMNREEELNDQKDTAENFEAEKAMAVNGSKVVALWELMREWLKGQTDSWDPANVLEQYKMVKITEAELLGLPTPSFEGEPQVPGNMEAEKTPEPAADDPPAS
ncbi:LOW QUALITY PROTEIN: hypothetical protein HID58_048439 [Brassica napus]|uniref:Uncharacterized protein n=1 Tax=Brassica napus TaxID=3708 RepID=A0ABQ8B247_BRANA|nr:LOW QUALITY PROTEIN: hypothetical protein HID58_048439 [Brassica napus]